MIYKKFGKLLMSAGGKLVKSCGHITFSVSGVIECDPSNLPWPNAMPSGSIIIPQVAENNDYIWYDGTIDNFRFQARWLKTGLGPFWDWFYITHLEEESRGVAFDDPTSPAGCILTNWYSVGWCNVTGREPGRECIVTGHDGTITVTEGPCV